MERDKGDWKISSGSSPKPRVWLESTSLSILIWPEGDLLKFIVSSGATHNQI